MAEPRGEFARIAALLARLPRGERVVIGPGDDAAVLRPRDGHDLVVTTDTFVEGRHFRRDLLSPAEIGSRLAAANLSDLAAMAAEPRWALVALAVPAGWSAEECEALEHGCAQALASEGAAVVGGNLASLSPPSSGIGPLVATVTLLGEVERGRAWTRAGARAGDVLAVTGVPGTAAAALALALGSTPPSWSLVPPPLRDAFVSPPCRVRVARTLAALGGVRAAIDLSDGLVGDLARLCEASGVGARIDESLLPANEGALLTYLKLAPSDDYELLLAVDSARWRECVAAAELSGTTLTAIGEVTAALGAVLRDSGGGERSLPGRGWDHFDATE